MAVQPAHRWWIYALRGIAGIAFGILTFMRPAASLLALVILFGAYALIDGALNLALAFRGSPDGRTWGSLVFQGIAGVVAGILTFIWPGMSALVLLLLIAAWSVVTGVTAIVAAVRLRKQIKGEWLLAISGVLSVAFGVLLFLFPGAGALAVVLWIGAYAIVFGVILVALGFRMRAQRGTPRREVPSGEGLHVPA
jgi:uncharacterized membrane protein HdeD (DUF308 family)